MSIIIRLQNLPWSANASDIREFFLGLNIPEGGVHIVGGDEGDAFIAFSTDEDGRLAMRKAGGTLKGAKVSLLLSSRSEMQTVIEAARLQSIESQPLPQTHLQHSVVDSSYPKTSSQVTNNPTVASPNVLPQNPLSHMDRTLYRAPVAQTPEAMKMTSRQTDEKMMQIIKPNPQVEIPGFGGSNTFYGDLPFQGGDTKLSEPQRFSQSEKFVLDDHSQSGDNTRFYNNQQHLHPPENQRGAAMDNPRYPEGSQQYPMNEGQRYFNSEGQNFLGSKSNLQDQFTPNRYGGPGPTNFAEHRQTFSPNDLPMKPTSMAASFQGSNYFAMQQRSQEGFPSSSVPPFHPSQDPQMANVVGRQNLSNMGMDKSYSSQVLPTMGMNKPYNSLAPSNIGMDKPYGSQVPSNIGMDKPYGSQVPPNIGMDKPYGSQVPPNMGMDKPYGSQVPPNIGMDKPYGSQVPSNIGMDKPYGSQVPSNIGMDKPYGSQVPSNMGMDKPYGSQVPPNIGMDKPYSSQVPPNIGMDKPYSSPVPPNLGVNKPYSSQVPTDIDVDKPYSSQVPPNISVNKPYSSQVPPNIGVAKPYSSQVSSNIDVDKPYSSQVPPMMGVNKPYNSRAPPSIGMDKPYSSQVPPNIGVNKPYSARVPPNSSLIHASQSAEIQGRSSYDKPLSAPMPSLHPTMTNPSIPTDLNTKLDVRQPHSKSPTNSSNKDRPNKVRESKDGRDSRRRRSKSRSRSRDRERRRRHRTRSRSRSRERRRRRSKSRDRDRYDRSRDRDRTKPSSRDKGSSKSSLDKNKSLNQDNHPKLKENSGWKREGGFLGQSTVDKKDAFLAQSTVDKKDSRWKQGSDDIMPSGNTGRNMFNKFNPDLTKTETFPNHENWRTSLPGKLEDSRVLPSKDCDEDSFNEDLEYQNLNKLMQQDDSEFDNKTSKLSQNFPDAVKLDMNIDQMMRGPPPMIMPPFPIVKKNDGSVHNLDGTNQMSPVHFNTSIMPPNMTVNKSSLDSFQPSKNIDKLGFPEENYKKPYLYRDNVESPVLGRDNVESPILGRDNVERPILGRDNVGRPNFGKNDLRDRNFEQDTRHDEFSRDDMERPMFEKNAFGRPDYSRNDSRRPNFGIDNIGDCTEERPPFDNDNVGPSNFERSNVGLPYLERGNIGRPNFERGNIDRSFFDRGNVDEDRPFFRRGNIDRPPFERGNVDRPPFERGNVDRPPFERGNVDRPSFERGNVDRPPFERGNVDRPPFERLEYEIENVGHPDFESGEIDKPDFHNLDTFDFEHGNVRRPGFESSDVDRPNFERDNIGRPNFERDNIGRSDFERDNVGHPGFERGNVNRAEYNEDDVNRPDFERGKPGRSHFSRDNLKGPSFNIDDMRRNNLGRTNFNKHKFDRENYERPDLIRDDARRPNFQRGDINMDNSAEFNFSKDYERRPGFNRDDQFNHGRMVDRNDLPVRPQFRRDDFSKDYFENTDEFNNFNTAPRNVIPSKLDSEDSQSPLPYHQQEDKAMSSEESGSRRKFTHSVEVRNIPNYSTYEDIRKIFQHINLPENCIKFVEDKRGNKNIRRALIKFATTWDARLAIRESHKFVNDRKIIVLFLNDDIFDNSEDFYKNNTTNSSNEQQLSCIKVSYLLKNFGQTELSRIFCNYKFIEIIIEKSSDESFQNGFVKFETFQEAEKAMRELSNYIIGGNRIQMNLCSGPCENGLLESNPSRKPLLPLPRYPPMYMKKEKEGSGDTSNTKERDPNVASIALSPKRPLDNQAKEQISSVKKLKTNETPAIKNKAEELKNKGPYLINKEQSLNDETSKNEESLQKSMLPSSKDIEGSQVQGVNFYKRATLIIPRDRLAKISFPNTNTQKMEPEEIKINDSIPKMQATITTKPVSLVHSTTKITAIEKVSNDSCTSATKPAQTTENVEEKIDLPNKDSPKLVTSDILTDSVVMRNVPSTATESDIRDFFSDEGLVPERVFFNPALENKCSVYIVFPFIWNAKKAVGKTNENLGRAKVFIQLIAKPIVMKAMGEKFDPLDLIRRKDMDTPPSQTDKFAPKSSKPDQQTKPETSKPNNDMNALPVTFRANNNPPPQTPRPNNNIVPIQTPRPNNNNPPAQTPRPNNNNVPPQIPRMNNNDVPIQTPRPNNNNAPPQTPRPNNNIVPLQTPRPNNNNAPPQSLRPYNNNVPPQTPRPNTNNVPPQTPRTNNNNAPPLTPRPNNNNVPPQTLRPNNNNVPPQTLRPNNNNVPPQTPRPNNNNVPPQTPRPNNNNVPPQIPRMNNNDVPSQTSRPNNDSNLPEIPRPNDNNVPLETSRANNESALPESPSLNNNAPPETPRLNNNAPPETPPRPININGSRRTPILQRIRHDSDKTNSITMTNSMHGVIKLEQEQGGLTMDHPSERLKGRLQIPSPSQSKHFPNKANIISVAPPSPPSIPAIKTGRQMFGEDGCVLNLKNVPFDATTQDILSFFHDFRYLIPASVFRRYDDLNQPTSDARVSFASKQDAENALQMNNKKWIFNRPIYLSLVE